MHLRKSNPTSVWMSPVCSALLTRTVKRYALLRPEFMFAAAGAGTISVLRTFEAVELRSPVRDLLQWRISAICRRPPSLRRHFCPRHSNMSAATPGPGGHLEFLHAPCCALPARACGTLYGIT